MKTLWSIYFDFKYKSTWRLANIADWVSERESDRWGARTHPHPHLHVSVYLGCTCRCQNKFLVKTVLKASRRLEERGNNNSNNKITNTNLSQSPFGVAFWHGFLKCSMAWTSYYKWIYSIENCVFLCGIEPNCQQITTTIKHKQRINIARKPRIKEENEKKRRNFIQKLSVHLTYWKKIGYFLPHNLCTRTRTHTRSRTHASYRLTYTSIKNVSITFCSIN